MELPVAPVDPDVPVDVSMTVAPIAENAVQAKKLEINAQITFL